MLSFSAIDAPRYDVPQQHVLQGTSCNQKTISSEGTSHSDGVYTALSIPEGHHIYGHGNAQEPVYNNFQDPKIMSLNYGSGIDQPLYYAWEDLSVKDSGESVNNGPTEPEPMSNALEEPYAEGSEEPGCHGNVTVDGPLYDNLEEPYQYA